MEYLSAHVFSEREPARLLLTTVCLQNCARAMRYPQFASEILFSLDCNEASRDLRYYFLSILLALYLDEFAEIPIPLKPLPFFTCYSDATNRENISLDERPPEFDHDGSLRRACPHQAIEWLTRHEATFSNKAVEELLVTHDIYLDHVQLLEFLKIRFATTASMETKLRVLQIVRFWVAKFMLTKNWERDYLAPQQEFAYFQILAWLREQVAGAESVNLRRVFAHTLEVFVAESKKLEATRDAKRRAEMALISVVPNSSTDNSRDLMDYPALAIAQQITLACARLFVRIKTDEFKQSKWLKKDNHRLAPNILKLTNEMSCYTNWFALYVLSKKPEFARRNALEKLLQIGKHFISLGNYHGVMLIMSALNCSPCHRLKKTFADLPKGSADTFVELTDLSSSSRGYINLRKESRLRNYCLPYIGVYLQDLTFIEEGNPDFSDVINFCKMRIIASILIEIRQMQEGALEYEKELEIDPLMQQKIRFKLEETERSDFPDLDDLSQAVEPKEEL